MVEECEYHFLILVKSRNEHNYCQKISPSYWTKDQSKRILKGDLSAYYAKKAFIPVIPQGTMASYFAQKQELDVNMF